MEFLSFLSNNRSNYEISVKRDKLFVDFISHLTDIEENSFGLLRAQKLMKANTKKIEASFDKILKKLHNVFWNFREGRVYFDENIGNKEIKDFFGTLKWIHKSDQRIVRWIILYLFYNKKENIIKITDVEKYSKKLIKSDLNKNIKKIVNDKYYSVNIAATS